MSKIYTLTVPLFDTTKSFLMAQISLSSAISCLLDATHYAWESLT